MIKSVVTLLEIPIDDFDKSVAFYQALFGEKLGVPQFGNKKMVYLMRDGKSVCSIPSTPSLPGFAPSSGGALVYLQMRDLDASVKATLDNGVAIVTPEIKIQANGWGYFAVITDPVGNRIGLYGDK